MRREAVLRVSMALVTATAALLLALGPQPSAASNHSMTPVAGPGVAAGAGVYPPRVTLIADSVGGVLFWAVPQRERLAKGLDFRLEVEDLPEAHLRWVLRIWGGASERAG